MARSAAVHDRVRSTAGARRRRLPPRVRSWLSAQLDAAAVDLEPEDAVVLALGAAAGAAILVLGPAPRLAAPAFLTTLAAAVASLRLARSRVRRRFEAALPAALEHVAAHLRAGGTVPTALDALADADGPLARDLRRIRGQSELGAGLAATLRRWPDEQPVPEVKAVAGALVVAATTGGPAAGALEGLARSLRDRLGARAEAAALSAQARCSAVVVGAAPIAYVAFAVVVDPSSAHALVATGTGRFCLVTGLALEVVAAWWMRRIAGSEP
jgi:tight adherence protein B